jgi:hypothetical protein
VTEAGVEEEEGVEVESKEVPTAEEASEEAE